MQRREALSAPGTWRSILYLFLKFIIVYFAATKITKIITLRTSNCHRRMNRKSMASHLFAFRFYSFMAEQTMRTADTLQSGVAAVPRSSPINFNDLMYLCTIL